MNLDTTYTTEYRESKRNGLQRVIVNHGMTCPICGRVGIWYGGCTVHGDPILYCFDCPDCKNLDKNLNPINDFFFVVTLGSTSGNIPDWELNRINQHEEKRKKKALSKEKRKKNMYKKRLSEWRERQKNIFSDTGSVDDARI